MTTFEIPLVCDKVADHVPLCLATSTVQTTVMEMTRKAHGRSRVAEAGMNVLPFARKHLAALVAITGATVCFTHTSFDASNSSWISSAFGI